MQAGCVPQLGYLGCKKKKSSHNGWRGGGCSLVQGVKESSSEKETFGLRPGGRGGSKHGTAEKKCPVGISQVLRQTCAWSVGGMPRRPV